MLRISYLPLVLILGLASCVASSHSNLTRRANAMGEGPPQIPDNYHGFQKEVYNPHTQNYEKISTIDDESNGTEEETGEGMTYQEEKYLTELEREIALAPANLMDQPIPSKEAMALANPLKPGSTISEEPFEDHQSDQVVHEGTLTNPEDQLPPEKQEENDHSSEQVDVDEYMTKSGVSLKFVNFSDDEDEGRGSHTLVDESSGNSNKSILEQITEKTKNAFRGLKDWFKTNILRWPESDSVLRERYIAQADKIADNYNVDYNHRNDYYEVGFTFLPKVRTEETPAKYSRMGGDSLFVSQTFEGGEMALGIAKGIDDLFPRQGDSSDFSRELCHMMNAVFRNPKTRPEMNPVSLLKEALEEIKVSERVDEGSATVLVGIFTPGKTVKVGNLGSSEAMLFRNGQLTYSTPISVNENGEPRRLTKAFRYKSKSKYFLSDAPDEGINVEWELKTGDYLLFATDGITNNLELSDFEELIQEGMRTGSHASAITSNIIGKAYFRSLQLPSTRESGETYGGVQDDMTIVMVKIKT